MGKGKEEEEKKGISLLVFSFYCVTTERKRGGEIPLTKKGKRKTGSCALNVIS